MSVLVRALELNTDMTDWIVTYKYICAFKPTIADQPLQHPLLVITCFMEKWNDSQNREVKAVDLWYAHLPGRKHQSPQCDWLPVHGLARGIKQKKAFGFFPHGLNWLSQLQAVRRSNECFVCVHVVLKNLHLQPSQGQMGSAYTIPSGGKEKAKMPV